MSKASCPAGCGKRFISAVTAHAHADQVHPGWDEPTSIKRKGWATPHGFVDFREPVTYADACERAEKVLKHVWEKRKDQANE